MVYKTPEEQAQPGENENRVIGCLLVDASCQENLPGLGVEHFYSNNNRTIFKSIKRLLKTGDPIDVGTVADDLAEHGTLTDIGGAPYLLELMESAPQIAHFEHYAKKVIERRERAMLKNKCRELMEALDGGEKIETVLADVDFSTDAIRGKRFEFHDAKALVEGDFKQEYLIPGFLAKGQTCLIAGPKKCLKTNILLLIAFCLVTANMLFRKFSIPVGCNVGIMSGESGPATIQETFRRIAISYGWSPQNVDGFHICFKLPSLTNPVDLSEIRRFIKDNNLNVFIFDPAYLCLSLGDGASNLFSVGEKLKPLTELGQETGCTIILVHHTRKSNGQNQYSEPELEEIAFAGFQEWARQWILLNRREAYKPDEPGVHKLWLVAGGSAGHSQSWALDVNEGSREDEGGRIWETRLFPAKEARAEKQTERERQKEAQKEALLESDQQKVLKVLQDAENPLPASKIRDKANIPTGRNNDALKLLVKSGDISCEKMKARNGHPVDHFSIAAGTAGSNGKESGFPPSRSVADRERERSPFIGDLPAFVRVPETVSEKREDSDSNLSGRYDDIFPAQKQETDQW